MGEIRLGSGLGFNRVQDYSVQVKLGNRVAFIHGGARVGFRARQIKLSTLSYHKGTSPAKSLAAPKSASLRTGPLATKTFAGLISRCITDLP